MISDLCERGACETCFEDELDGCRHECHPVPTDCLAGVSRPTTEQPSAGGARQAYDPAGGLPRTVRAASAEVRSGPAVSGAPHGTAGGKTSPQLRRERAAAGTPGPDTAPAPPLLGAAAVRARDKAPAGGVLAQADALSAGSRAIAAAMSEDRGPDSLDAHVRRLCDDLGLLRYHTHDSRRSPRGYPDLTIAGPGGQMWRELKTQRGKVSVEQQGWLDVLAAGGGNAGVWRPEHLLSGQVAIELAAISALRAVTA